VIESNAWVVISSRVECVLLPPPLHTVDSDSIGGCEAQLSGHTAERRLTQVW